MRSSCAELPGSVEGLGDAVSQPYPLRIERKCVSSADGINALAASCAGTAFHERVARVGNFVLRFYDNFSLKNTGIHCGSLFDCGFKFGIERTFEKTRLEIGRGGVVYLLSQTDYIVAEPVAASSSRTHCHTIAY